MRKDSPSKTAFKVAMMRAAHQILDDPVIFKDPVALKLAGPEIITRIKNHPEIFNKGLNKNFRAIATARSRLAEEDLKNSVSKGVDQYVVLGAGFDTYAYRNSNSDLKIFEVDFPATQKEKQKKLKESGIEIPDNLTFVPVDFETDNLEDKLLEKGFKKEIPAFFSWLGVSMYLEKNSMMKTLGFISTLEKGSCILFDYIVPVSGLGLFRKVIYILLKTRLKFIGEPWINFLDPTQLKSELISSGFSVIRDFGPDEINDKYFKNRKDWLRAGKAGHIMLAEV